MSENTPALIESDPVDVEFDLDAWIDGVSAAQRSVPIYARPDLFGRYEEVQRQIEVLEHATKGAEGSVTDQEELGSLYAEREALYEQQRASKTTWYVQALDSAVIAAINAEHPVPDLPEAPKEPATNAPKSLHDRYRAALKRHHEKVADLTPKRVEASDGRNIALIAAAVVRIADHGDRTLATGATPAQLRALQAKPFGPIQLGSLLTAALQAKAQAQVIPAPFSPGKQENALG